MIKKPLPEGNELEEVDTLREGGRPAGVYQTFDERKEGLNAEMIHAAALPSSAENEKGLNLYREALSIGKI